MEDDDGDFLAAAREDDALVAKLLIRLSRSGTCVPWGHLPESSSKPQAETGVPVPPLLPPTRTWGRRRARSAPVMAEGATAAKREEEAAGRASPATPLSWGGASGTSGSGSDDGWSTPPSRPRKRRRRRGVHEPVEPVQPPQPPPTQVTEVCHGTEEQIGDPPAKGTVPELSEGGGSPARGWATVGSSDEDGEPHGDSVVGAMATVGSPAIGSGSGKGGAVAVVAAPAATSELGPTSSAAHAEPLRSRLTCGGAGSVVLGRQGKKKTVQELRAMKDSLLREQEQLQKELGKQREIYGALMEENMALKKLELSLPSTTPSQPTVRIVRVEAKSGEPQHIQSISVWQAPKGIATASVHDEDSHELLHCTSSSSPVPARTFLFDLNCLPDGGL